MTHYVVVSGTPVDGFTITGPFASHEEAVSYAHSIDIDWWVTKLADPEVEAKDFVMELP